MTEYLVAMALGPVQEFITAARKTRDLWAGSWLLSELSRAAAESLADTGAHLIFPAQDALAGAGGVANKLLATADTEDPRGLAEGARLAAQRELERHATSAVDRARRSGLPVAAEVFQAQITDFLEWYAAWVPFSHEGYGAARVQVERLLAGRKALRDFRPARGIPGRWKSSLDPSRDTVLDWDRGSSSPLPGVNDGEQLDAISLVKRLGEPKRFRSVSRVAVDPFIRRLAASETGQETLRRLNGLAGQLRQTRAVESLEDPSDPFPWDTELWYSDHADDPRVPAELKSVARDFHQIALGAAARLKVELPAYYALLKADGDRMGRLIGELAGPGEHRALSGQLVRFASAADDVVRRHFGALIYSGGDDVLALVPLDRVLACAGELRRRFTDLVPEAGHVRPSLSVGIAVAHYNEPLIDVRRWAEEAEQRAKVHRDAVVVAVHTRSGGRPAVAGSSGSGGVALERLDRWASLLRQEAIPDGTAYELRALAAELAGQSEDVSGTLVVPEVERILRRKRAERGTVEMAEETRQAILGHLGTSRDGGPAAQLALLADELVVARHLARAVDLADGPLPRLERSASHAG